MRLSSPSFGNALVEPGRRQAEEWEMSQDVSVSTEGPLDLAGTPLRKVTEIPYAILLRELDRVVAAGETSAPPLAGFNSRIADSMPPSPTHRVTEPTTTPGTATSCEK